MSPATIGTNFSDQWWNADESGWGISVHQQADVLFVDLFVYGADGSPTWYTAAATAQKDPTTNHAIFTGDLFRSTGPVFAGAFDPNLVAYRKVGTLTFDAASTENASLSYSVDGSLVAKAVTRQPWKLEDFSGTYQGAFVYEVEPLHGTCIGGHAEDAGPITIVHSQDRTFNGTAQFRGTRCTFTAQYAQSGHMGSAQGTFTCADLGHGPFGSFEMERTASGMTGRFTAETTFCGYSGRFGGVLR